MKSIFIGIEMMTETKDEKSKIKLNLKSKKQRILRNSKTIELGLMQVEVKGKKYSKDTNKS